MRAVPLQPFPPVSLRPFPSSSSSSSLVVPSKRPPQFPPAHLSQPLKRSSDHRGKPDDLLVSHYCYLLHRAISLGDLGIGKSVHAISLKTIFPENQLLINNLIAFYTKMGLLLYAVFVFKSMESPNLVSWTAMVCGYANFGLPRRALKAFFEMRNAGFQPNEFGVVALLIACGQFLAVGLSRQVHGLAMKLGYMSSVFVSNALMAVYVKCGCFWDAHRLFDEMPQRDAISYNTAILSLRMKFGLERAIELMGEMQKAGYKVDQYTLSNVIKAAAAQYALVEGKQLHAYALRAGFESNVVVNNALIGFYTKCCGIKDVENLFGIMSIRDVVSWTGMITSYSEHGLIRLAVSTFNEMPEKNPITYNALMAGYVHNDEGLEAIRLFEDMLKVGIGLSSFTLTSALKACSLLLGIPEGKQIHGFAVKTGFWMDSYVVGATINMYATYGLMKAASKLFDDAYSPSSIDWTTIISRYARNGWPDLALFQFMETVEQGIAPIDEYVISAIFGVCGALGFKKMGSQLHSYAVKMSLVAEISVGNSIVTMYSKCGSMDEARKIFDLMPEHDIVSWNALIMGYILHRLGDAALIAFTEMEHSGIKPDSLTLIAALSACKYTHCSSTDRCRKIFDSMTSRYGIEPSDEHYACVVDVLGRSGDFHEAETFIKQMSSQPGPLVWRALLATSRIQKNKRLEIIAAHNFCSMQPQDAATYILICNLYSASGRWHLSEKVKEDMKKRVVQKHPARSWTIINNQVHSFYARDQLHLQTKDIYSGLEILILECRMVGYVPDISFVLHEVEEYQKENFLYYHSPKLAFMYGLLMTKPGQVIQVVKNIQLCGDCHQFMKYASHVTKRDICLRDVTGFHYFKGGNCSCRDRW